MSHAISSLEPTGSCSPRGVDIIQADKTCLLSVIDTTCSLTVPAETLVEPIIHGFELMNLPTLSFLITYSTSRRQLLFDLGCCKAFWDLQQPIINVIDTQVPRIRVEHDLADVLIRGGVDIARLEAAIISHHHYDHTGDAATFPDSMDLLVGPEFISYFLPGYPTNEGSPVFEDAIKGRCIREIVFSADLLVAGFEASDYFEDGSLYVLDTPGHAVGHISALVRTTTDSYVLLGGDICHFGGINLPNKYVPLPDEFTEQQLG
ncbi:hypothetical protein PFICI_07352 [Pestalotiopsis fici W106-1]|uniref:Metallo-beta-lactamase domain-containing protein n=1 Tax=Pestalotiopsis fici (strain W106-1 / CGMCC3.15140) TaxID=1229662 RepID=W3X124_PESFW|nr:uncharacterized protein PFICI_07352 [Pestalotiopsis fici W106-1]ETS79823.1 hypothetical protein PFICI_07352 [Pestalotiopsis fici W106-1]